MIVFTLISSSSQPTLWHEWLWLDTIWQIVVNPRNLVDMTFNSDDLENLCWAIVKVREFWNAKKSSQWSVEYFKRCCNLGVTVRQSSLFIQPLYRHSRPFPLDSVCFSSAMLSRLSKTLIRYGYGSVRCQNGSVHFPFDVTTTISWWNMTGTRLQYGWRRSLYDCTMIATTIVWQQHNSTTGMHDHIK